MSIAPPKFVASQVVTVTCGCADSCTSDILNMLAGDYTCGDRIRYLVNSVGNTETDACKKVAGVEFPCVCGKCDPDKCINGPSPVTVTVAPTLPPAPAPSSLYCFPNDDGINSRVTYPNIWADYNVQVKEGNICGPGNNRFSRNTVSRDRDRDTVTDTVTDTTGDDLVLQFKKNGSVWEASEVRVVNSNGSPFRYGNYTFHVKSVAVKNSSTGNTIAHKLPINIVLGLFTWDPTDRYDVHENWNHEVDIEISQWGSETNKDAQFLMQPDGYPQKYRFYSGSSSSSSFQQSDQWYSFQWLPNQISWLSTAGGGQTHLYTTEHAVTNGCEDYVQCLPANVEIRLNLWSKDGLNSPPTGLNDDDYVQVVIGSFAYQEAVGVEFVEPGGYCSKHCQCEADLGCVNGKCVAPPTTEPPTTTPSSSPTTTPTTINTSITCNDSPFPFRTINPTTSRNIWKTCAWVAKRSTNRRCQWRYVSTNCPFSCNTCDICADSETRFKFYSTPTSTKKIARSCEWTSMRKSKRCAIDGMEDTCRKTCGTCS